MSIEKALADLQAAVEANTAALLGSSAEPSKRGRKAKGEVDGVAVVAAVTPVVADAPTVAVVAPVAPVAQADPFDTAAPPPVTKDDVRKAAQALAAATSQQNAIDVIVKATGKHFPELASQDDFHKALKALQSPAAPVTEADPFATSAAEAVTSTVTKTSAIAAVAEDVPTPEQVRHAVLETQKKTGTEIVQQVVMKHGGVNVNSQGQQAPSLKAIPVQNYKAFLEALKALPKTK